MVEELTALEYALSKKMSTSAVYGMIKEGRLPGTKVGKKWLIPSDAIPAPVGEKATVQVVNQPTEQPTIQPKVKEDEVVNTDAIKVELDKREEALKVREGELTRLASSLSSEQDAQDRDQRKLDNLEGALQDWLDNANEKVVAVVDLVLELKKGGYEQQVPVGGINYKTVPHFTEYTKTQVRNLLNRIASALVGIMELEKPRFAGLVTEQGSGDTFDDEDEQEPDDVDQDEILEKVEQEVDKTVEKVESEVPIFAVNVAKNKRGKK